MFYSCVLSNGNYFLVIAVGSSIWSAKPPDAYISLIYGGKATYNLGNGDTSCVAVRAQNLIDINLLLIGYGIVYVTNNVR